MAQETGVDLVEEELSEPLLTETLSPEPPMAPWADEHRWSPSRIRGPVQSVDSTKSGEVLVLLEDGSVWVRTSGLTWTMILEPSGGSSEDEVDAETLLLEVESSLDDVLEAPDPADIDTEDEVQFVESPATQDLSSLDMGLLLAAEQKEGKESAAPSGRIWAAGTSQVLVSRDDGCWFSMDYGHRWIQLTFLPAVHALLELENGGLLLGTEEGIWIREDRGDWEPVGGTLAGLAVQSLAQDGTTLYVGTRAGLFLGSLDTSSWSRAEAAELAGRSVRSILLDPAWEEGLWLATDLGIYRSDDGGRTVRIAGRNPLAKTEQLLGLDSPGHVVAVGDGAWESVDGGVRWRSISIGLSGPDQWAATRTGPDLWIGGSGGLALLSRAPLVTPATEFVSVEGLPDVGELVERAITRQGLDLNPLLIQRSIRRALLAPQLTITGAWQRDQSIDADFEARTNTQTDDVAWEVVARLCYGHCGAPSSGVGSEALFSGDSDLLTSASDLDVAVVGDQVYVLEGASGYTAVAANVSDRATRYRRSVADTVTELYFSRLMLSHEVSGAATLSIGEQVALNLDIQEVTARLDAYTDGYFSRALAAR